MTHPAFHRIPFESVSKEIHDTVELGGSRYRFLFDTGAPLCISQGLQEAHRYAVIHEADLADANAAHSTATIVLVDSIRWGGMLFLDVPAVVLDIAHSPLAKDGVEGLIGGNLLQHLAVRFDLARKEILLSDDPARLHWDEDRAEPGSLDGQDNFLFTCSIGTCFLDTVQFDSGMRDLYVMGRSVATAHVDSCAGNGLCLRGGHGGRSQGMLGKDKGDKPLRLRASAVHLGSTDLGAMEITTTPSTSRMGRELLKLGTLTLNYLEPSYVFVPYAREH